MALRAGHIVLVVDLHVFIIFWFGIIFALSFPNIPSIINNNMIAMTVKTNRPSTNIIFFAPDTGNISRLGA
jgi:hypothetical protein